MLADPKTIQHRYAKTVPVKESSGRKVLRRLPRRENGEMRRIKQILSSHKCRACAGCCRGFGISRGEENFEGIMKEVKAKRELFSRENLGGGVYNIYPPGGKNACGFLTWERGKITVWALGDEDIRKSGKEEFGCQIYDTRSASCVKYPFTASWLDRRFEPDLRGAGMVVLYWKCHAMLELVQNGIGHLTEREVFSFGAEPQGSMLSSLARSLKRVKEDLSEETLHNHAFYSEEGERVYPISLRSIVPVSE